MQIQVHFRPALAALQCTAGAVLTRRDLQNAAQVGSKTATFEAKACSASECVNQPNGL